jgi:hypothetical protein
MQLVSQGSNLPQRGNQRGTAMQVRAKKTEGGSGAGLFEPDILLPNQYFAAFRRGRAVEGERRLMLAVLEDAVDSYRKHAAACDPREQACFLEAKEWFSSSDRSWLFAFENICDVLEMNADYLRSGLDRLRRSATVAPGQLIRYEETLQNATA